MNASFRPQYQQCQVKLEPSGPHVQRSPLNQSDVAIVPAGHCSFNNRWRLENDVIDCNAVRTWTEPEQFTSIKLNWPHLKRIKIFGLPRHQMTHLLNKLNTHSSVGQLEIDTLELHKGVTSRYTFNSLDLLSIDSVRVIDISGHEMPSSFSSLEINAKELNTVYLGSNSIQYIEFNAPKIVFLSTDRIPANADLTQAPFRNLQAFVCNRVQDVNIELIGRIARGELLPCLQRLCCNLDHLLFTTYRPRTLPFQHLERLFNHLVVYGVRPRLEIYLNHCQFDGDRKFADYRFKADLVHLHYHNYVVNKLHVQRCPSVTSAEYLGVLDVFCQHNKKQRTAPLERTFDLAKFTRLYDCIRVVVLDNESTPKRSVNSALFLQFLTAHRALIELELRGARFGNENFYYRLVTVESLRSTLITLIVFEDRAEFREHIDFRFLNALSSLRRLQTNLVTSSAMPNLVAMMPVGSEFRLQSWHSSYGSLYYQYNINRVNDLYELRLESRSFTVDLKKEILLGAYALEGLQHTLRKEASLLHWLDEVPTHRANQLSLLLTK